MNKKIYIIREGNFGTNWEIIYYKGFETKKALRSYFKDVNGFQCYRSKRSCYDGDEEIYENQNEQYGYEIVTLEVQN